MSGELQYMLDDPSMSPDRWCQNLKTHLMMMEEWASGRRSWRGLVPNTPEAAAMDAQEVVKHGAAVQAYAALLAKHIDESNDD